MGRCGCVEVATIFLKTKKSSVGCMFLLLTDGNESERLFVFVPSRTAEVIGLKGTFDVDPGRGEFLLCLLLDACVASFAKHGISQGGGNQKRPTSDLCLPSPPPQISQSVVLCFLTLTNVVSHLFNF